MKKRRKISKEKLQLAKFVEAVSSKKYSKANKYLENVINNKLKQRIARQLDKPLFQ